MEWKIRHGHPQPSGFLMKFEKTRLTGLFVIQPEPRSDERGRLIRTFCEAEFKEAGLETHFPQISISRTTLKGTVRGMHYQKDPHAETKVIRCTRGQIFDVIVDLRPDSPSFLQWQSFELSAENQISLYVPTGCAHGLQSLEDQTEVHYMISTNYNAESASGCRWNDPKINIKWPIPEVIIAPKDLQWPLL